MVDVTDGAVVDQVNIEFAFKAFLHNFDVQADRDIRTRKPKAKRF
jgi:hypothetical protein